MNLLQNKFIATNYENKKKDNDLELIQSNPTSHPQIQKEKTEKRYCKTRKVNRSQHVISV